MSPRDDEDVRIVMLGKTGVGKSATGNTILGYEAFASTCSPISQTEVCQKARSVDGRKVSVVDTPGLFDTRFSEDKIIKEIKQCICFAAPGPHVFLLVIRLGRFTEEEQKSVEMIQEVFGEMSNKYTIILFTGGDQLGMPFPDFLNRIPKLQELIGRCDGRYHVFNNDTKDPSQVTELMVKIEQMAERNGRSHYTTEMFKDAEVAIQEEITRILTVNKPEILRRTERLTDIFPAGAALIQAEAQLQREVVQKARVDAEKKNSFLSSVIGSVVDVAKQLVLSLALNAIQQGIEKLIFG